MLSKIIVLIFVVGITWSLLYVKPNAKRILPRPILGNDYLDVELKYQIITMIMACLTLGLVFWAAPDSSQRYFSFGDIAAPALPVPAIGLIDQNWLQLGVQFAFIISGVTFVAIYLQLMRGRQLQENTLRFFLWGAALTLMNAFTEEMITRFSVVALLDILIPFPYVYLALQRHFGLLRRFESYNDISRGWLKFSNYTPWRMLREGDRHEKDHSISIGFGSSATGQWTATETGYASKRDNCGQRVDRLSSSV